MSCSGRAPAAGLPEMCSGSSEEDGEEP
jgi:hypothetical protein